MTVKAGTAVWSFVIASFIGWVYEEICTLIVFGEFADRGFLQLPLCPIYGFGAWLFFLCVYKIKNVALIVLVSAVMSGVYEYLCSYILEKVFNTSLWSYELWILSINGRISLLACLFFGLFTALFVKCVVPLVAKAVTAMPKWAVIVSSCLAVIVTAGDALDILI
ncbi:MAG: putative ABC transporter permease [Clostridiales bacterium]|nr:putative ABC transporter permease [Clostridiales bacterium]